MLALLALHAGLFLVIRTLFIEAEDLGLFFFVVGALLAVWPLHNRERVGMRWAGLWCTSFLHVLLYKYVSGLKFNLWQLIENPVEAGQSVILYFGEWPTVFLITEFAVTALILGAFFDRLWRILNEEAFPKVKLAMAAILILPASVGAWELVDHYLEDIPPLRLAFELGEGYAPKADESLLILQLESLNGPALFKLDQGRAVPRHPWPSLDQLEKLGGSWFPFFWGNAFGTNLGMSSILCGTSGSLVSKLVSPSDGGTCLPERFKRAGYRTAFYYSFKGAEFYSMQEHVGKLGFEEFHFGEKLMKPGDPFWQWGYEDCRFYDRALAHMKASGLDRRPKSFIYMSVHMNHIKFENHLKDVTHPYPQAQNLEQEYLNSAFEQDHCMAQFLGKVEALGRNDLNIFIVGDHGFPINPARGLRDQYMTSAYFLPAARRRPEFAKGPILATPAQDQILSTMLELFGAPRTPTSFYWALKGEKRPEDYRACHLVTDAGAKQAFVVKDQDYLGRSIRRNLFTASRQEGEAWIGDGALHTPADWQRVRVDAACRARLGAPL